MSLPLLHAAFHSNRDGLDSPVQGYIVYVYIARSGHRNDGCGIAVPQTLQGKEQLS
jgi:hypothetical protein